MVRRVKYGALLAALAVVGAAFGQIERPVRLGEHLPPLDLHYVKGEPIQRPDRHNVTLIEFWATWCKPCQITIPHLTELQHRYGERGLQIVGISDEPRKLVTEFVQAQGAKMDYAVAVDNDRKTTNRFRQLDSPIPRAYLFNETGKLIWIGHPADNDLERLIQELTDELQADS